MRVRVKKRLGNFVIDVAFNAGDSGVTALFGRSGAGKTSVLNMVAGLTTPDEGLIEVNGTALFDSQRCVNIPTEKRRCGYIFQDGRLFPHLTVKSNLVYGMKLLSSDMRYVKYDHVVDILGIGHLLERRPAKLSGGEKQRVAIGRALLASPAAILMDEPLASLDEERKDELLPFIAQLPHEFSIPVLYVSHSPDEVLYLSDAIVVLDKGRVVSSGPPTDFVTRFNGTRQVGTAL